MWVEVRRKSEEAARPSEVEAPSGAQPRIVEPAPAAAAAPATSPTPPAEHPALAAKAVSTPEPDIAPIAEIAARAELEEPELITIDSSTLDSDALDSIVVELPGDLASEVPLNAVPEHAIELIVDEPQGVPTEAEVDAMLAATATALLTSSLGSDPVLDEEITPIETIIPIDDGIHVRYGVEDALGQVVRVDATPASYVAAEAAFELSLPTMSSIAVLEQEEEYEAVGQEFTYERPVGAPLFSEEAILAASAAPVQDLEVEQALGRVDLAADLDREPADAAAGQPPPWDRTSDVTAIAPDEPPAGLAAAAPQEAAATEPVPVVDVSEQIAVWSTALTEWASVPVLRHDAPAASPAIEAAASPAIETRQAEVNAAPSPAPSVTEHIEPEPEPEHRTALPRAASCGDTHGSYARRTVPDAVRTRRRIAALGRRSDRARRPRPPTRRSRRSLQPRTQR